MSGSLPIVRPENSSVLLANPYPYVVAFSLSGPYEAYKDFFALINSCDAWCNYMPGVWLILSRLPLPSLSSALRQKIRTTDRLMVMPAKGPIDGWLPEEGWTWIGKHIPNLW